MSSPTIVPPARRYRKPAGAALAAGALVVALAAVASAVFLAGGSAGSDELDVAALMRSIECPDDVGVGVVHSRNPLPVPLPDGGEQYLGGSVSARAAFIQFFVEEGLGVPELTDYVRTPKSDDLMVFEQFDDEGARIDVLTVRRFGDQWFTMDRRGCVK